MGGEGSLDIDAGAELETRCNLGTVEDSDELI